MRDRRLTLFVDAHVFDREFQGAQTFLRELYTQLMADHPELDIYFGARNVQHIQAVFPQLPPSHILPYQKTSAGLLRYIFDIPGYIRQYRFDYAHFQYISPRNTADCRYIVTLHDVLFNDFKTAFSPFFRLSRDLLFGRSIKQAQIKTTVSAYSRQRICSHYNIPAQHLHVIPNGTSDGFSEQQSSRQDAADLIYEKFGISNYILYVSRIEPRKNQLLLLQKYLRLRLYRRGIALVFIGKESVQVPALTQLIAGLNSEQKHYFHWLPQVTQADLAAFYRACRLFVYPSRAEGFGIPPLEAAACQAPVLCSSATAMEDFSFFAPYTFNPDNEIEFEQKLSDIIDAPPDDTFTQSVAQHIHKHYNWKHSSELFYSLLQPNN